MNNSHDSLKISFRLIMGNRKPSVLFSTGMLVLTAFFCSVTLLICLLLALSGYPYIF